LGENGNFDWQVSAPGMEQREWDVIIAGAGPAGATAAYHLAAQGWRVLALDRERFPRDKVCGDGISSDTLNCLLRMGIIDEVRALGHATTELRIHSASGIAFAVPGEFLTLRRMTLDALIARRASQAGAVLAHGVVESLEHQPDCSVNCAIKGAGVVHARIGMVATGARIGLVAPESSIAPSGFAMRCYYRSAAVFDCLQIHFLRDILPGYGWIFPMGEGLYNIGCGSVNAGGARSINLHKVFESYVREISEAREIVRRGEQVEPLRGAMLRCGLQGAHCRTGSGLLSAGETMGTTIPLTGEGIGKAMESGEIAAQMIGRALQKGETLEPRELLERMREKYRPLYQGCLLAQKALAWVWVNDLAARFARRSSFVRSGFSAMASGTVALE